MPQPSTTLLPEQQSDNVALRAIQVISAEDQALFDACGVECGGFGQASSLISLLHSGTGLSLSEPAVAVAADEFIRDYLPNATSRWLLVLSARDFVGAEWDPDTDDEGLTPLARALFAHPTPLQLFVADDRCAFTRWPARMPHVLYRTIFSDGLDAAWGAPGSPLRDYPYGISPALHGDDLEALRAGAGVRADNRSLLFSFRGSASGQFTTGVRCAASKALHANKAELDSLMDRVMPKSRPDVAGNASLPHAHFSLTGAPPGAPPCNVSAEVEAPWGGHDASPLPYASMLGDSVFALALPGDFWESYRLWEAIEAGAIPIVQRIPDVYAGCSAPHTHVARRIDGLLWLDDWSQLPQTIERAFAEGGWEGLVRRQARIHKSYRGWAERTSQDILALARTAPNE